MSYTVETNKFADKYDCTAAEIREHLRRAGDNYPIIRERPNMGLVAQNCGKGH